VAAQSRRRRQHLSPELTTPTPTPTGEYWAGIRQSLGLDQTAMLCRGHRHRRTSMTSWRRWAEHGRSLGMSSWVRSPPSTRRVSKADTGESRCATSKFDSAPDGEVFVRGADHDARLTGGTR